MSGPLRLGLTGSIGMGKSTTAAMFADLGVPVWDADAAVRRLYAAGGAAVPAIAALHPPGVRDGAVDREALKTWIATEPDALARIEKVVHPLVARDRAQFMARTDAGLVLLDIPLLFEAGLEETVDRIAVVTAPSDLQRQRVLARPGMTEAQFQDILSRQTPDSSKRARADFVIETRTLDGARRQVTRITKSLRQEPGHA